ncbi:MAG TPA: aspartate 1-decarboxylase [Myxococcota bacterium]|nr:aspartate 1-decarboxylase [Myxococcota bacterium]
MMRTMMKSKIHRATVTEANLEYEGSITIDPDLLEAADLLPYERVDVLDVTNGARLQTYVIEGERGSGEICVNGAAAHLVKPHDLVIICSYVTLDDTECRGFEGIRVFVDHRNRVQEICGPSPRAGEFPSGA